MMAFWASRNPRERILLLFCIVAVLIGVPMMLTPPSAGGKALLPAAEASQKCEAIRKEKQALDQDSDKLKPQTAKLVYTASADELLPKVIKTLQGAAKDSGIHLREVKPLRGKRLGSVSRVPLQVRFTCEFGKCVPFVYRVEDPAGKLVVEKLTISQSDPKSRTVDVEAQVALFTQQGAATDEKGAGGTPGA